MSEETFGNFLKRKFHDFHGHEIRYGRPIPSQADWAKHLGSATTNLSVWMNDIRKPTGESVDLLADKLGVEVYDKLGVARRLPRKLNPLVDVVSQLDETGQKAVLEYARNMKDRQKGGTGSHTETAFA